MAGELVSNEMICMAMQCKFSAAPSVLQSAMFKPDKERSGLTLIKGAVFEEGNSNDRQQRLLKVAFNHQFRTCL